MAAARGGGGGPRPTRCGATRRSSPALGGGPGGAAELGKVGSGRKGGAARRGLEKLTRALGHGDSGVESLCQGGAPGEQRPAISAAARSCR